MINFRRMAKDTAFWENERILTLERSSIIHAEFDGDRDWFIGFGSSYFGGFKMTENCGTEITVNQAWHELGADLYEAAVGARNVFGNDIMDGIDEIVCESLIYMVYQMGEATVSKFKNTKLAIVMMVRKDTNVAREAVRFNMLDSEWFRMDSPKRAKWTADRIMKKERLNPRSYRYA